MQCRLRRFHLAAAKRGHCLHQSLHPVENINLDPADLEFRVGRNVQLRRPHTIPHSHTHICACHTRTYPHPQYSHSHSSSHSHPQSPASLLSSLSLWSVPQPLLLEPLHSHLCNSNVTLGQGRGNRAPDVCQRTKGLPLCSRPTDASS